MKIVVWLHAELYFKYRKYIWNHQSVKFCLNFFGGYTVMYLLGYEVDQIINNYIFVY